ncbi:hypothetical protein HERIO_1680 [Hepatospora eriocheir]|uniref:Uncharacterized protein n=1 Tax=Hepatospora eriocheir TaxID=1081669 RepID=A0A1X0Q9D9_9MICR|nr:hypothetical protein HERIO_1680 [Hepatospora eriocheir]
MGVIGDFFNSIKEAFNTVVFLIFIIILLSILLIFMVSTKQSTVIIDHNEFSAEDLQMLKQIKEERLKKEIEAQNNK